MRTPPSAPSPPPCAAAKRKAADGEVFSGDMICKWGQSFRLGFAHPPVGGGSFALPFLRTGMFFQNIPVFRMAYFTIKPYYGLISKTLMLQVRFAHPPMPHRTSSSSCSGVPVGLFSTKSTQYSLLQNARPPGSLRSPSGGRGELRSPLHPPLPPPLFIGRFAAFDRQIPKEDVFIPPNAAFAQLSLAHSAAFCYSFLNNRTRCGKRRLLP